MKYITIDGKKTYFTDDEARNIAKELFAQAKIDDVENALDRMDIKATSEQKKEIANNLFEEIFDRDDEYWEIEDKNILYLAGELGIAHEQDNEEADITAED